MSSVSGGPRTLLRLEGLSVLVAGHRASAQVTATDSDAVATGIAKSLLLDLRAVPSYHAPVRFATGSNASMAPWVSRVVALVGRESPGVLADSGVRSASTFVFSDVSIVGQKVVVHGAFASCDPGRSGLNFWSLAIEIEMSRQGSGWEPKFPRSLDISDGICSVKRPN